MRHTGRIMVREIGTNMEEDPGKERDTDRKCGK